MQLQPRPLAIALSVAFPFAMPALAQTSPLPSVVVTAPREASPPAGAGSLGAGDVASRRSYVSDTARLLDAIPGLSLSAAGGVSSLPAIHGLGDDRLRIRVDGMDLVSSCPNHMNPPMSYLDPAQVRRVSVWAGIAPVSVGGDSLGGSIVVETAPPEFAAPGQGPVAKGEASAYFRGNNGAYGGGLSASLAGESASIRYSGATAQADNHTAGGSFKTDGATGRVGHALPLDEVGSTAYKSRNHDLSFAYRNGIHLLEAKLGYQDIPYQLYPNQRMDMLGNTQHRVSLRYLGELAWGTVEVRAWRETVDHYMDFGADKRFWYGALSQPPAAPETGTPCTTVGMNCASGMPMYSDGETRGATAVANVGLTREDLLRVGAEFQRYRLDEWWPPSGGMMSPGTFVNVNDGRRDRDALFGEWERRHDARWLTLVGVRYERVKSDAGEVRGYDPGTNGMGMMASWQKRDADAFNAADRSRTDGNWDATALARFTPDAGLDVELGVARKVRSPNLYQRYTWSTWSMAAVMNNLVGDGNGYVGNLDLKRETAGTVSATFDWHAPDRAWELRFTPYYTRVSDYIDAVQWNAATNAPATVQATNQFVVLKYVNHSARLQGFDLSGRAPLAKTALGEFGVAGLLAWVDGENRTTGDELYGIMPLHARVTLTHALGGWSGGIEAVMVARKDGLSGARNEIATPGYGLVNLRASYSWKPFRFDFGVENLFDRSYRLPTGGAYVGQGSTMSMNGVPWGIAVPGMGRSVYAGVSVAL
ncbi:MAG: TonB-dependent receptor [Burkholderiales bacterium]|nr:TonB-dependent receptor [Burkholderiales bacterium]